MISTPHNVHSQMNCNQQCSTFELLQRAQITKKSKSHVPFSPVNTKTTENRREMRKHIINKKKKHNSQHEQIPIRIHRNTDTL